MKINASLSSLVAACALVLASAPWTDLRASDHADGPTVAGDQAADLADSYMFVDPTDPTKLILINTIRGFIVPGEAVNFALFDSTVRYRFQIENTGDAKSDAFIDVTFSEKEADGNSIKSLPKKQTATVTLSGAAFTGLNRKLTGTTTNPGLGATVPDNGEVPPDTYFPATPQKLKDPTGAQSSIEFFAGETDDPFFFDIPGFIRFRNSIFNGAPDVSKLARGRDTFAGYNVLTVAFRVPIAALKNTSAKVTNATKFGLSVLSQRRTERASKGRKVGSGAFATVDREGLPALNALLVPLNFKNAYNAATTQDDAAGKFAGALVDTLKQLGTHTLPLQAGQLDNIGTLAGLAVANGDILRIDTTQPNGFPNGRLPADDVVKTLLTIISNSNETGATLDDGVAANDTEFSANFPYLGLPQQPRDPSADPVKNVDDNTRN